MAATPAPISRRSGSRATGRCASTSASDPNDTNDSMRLYNSIAGHVRAAAGVSAAASMLLLGACNATDTLLEATDPDIIAPGNANSAEGALALYNGALSRLKTIG